MATVWDKSQHSGTNLLMLLAIADFADDDGVAFPSVGKLATKCRMSKRNAQDRLRELADSGELTVKKNEGPPPKFPNLFMINLKSLGVKSTAPVQPTAPVQFDVSRGAVHCAQGVKPTAPKPSYNHQEPSLFATHGDCDQAKPVRVPACPQEKILTLYSESLPELTQPRTWAGQREVNLRARWRWVMTAKRHNGDRYATTEAEGLEFFGMLFGYVGKSDFLMGRSGDWQCDLPWLMKAENFAKVIEGKYENREAV